MILKRLLSIPAALLAAGCGAGDGLLDSAPTLQADLKAANQANILTVEHLVPHISTVPANAGASVLLSVHERVREQNQGAGAPRVVLFLHGNTFPGVPGADLRLKHYDWMLELAKAGFDAFTMDNSGYGFSPRPMMDNPCNVDPPSKRRSSSPIHSRPCARQRIAFASRPHRANGTRSTEWWTTSVPCAASTASI